ncbi:MAG: tRNA glutamyl-Q(34) synthetase GluQRS [Pseudomonadota bacterium]
MKLDTMADDRPSGVVERFAPSPTGQLHLGHAFSAMLAHDAARAASGQFLLRVEDLDRGRARTAYATALIVDLRWLGIVADDAPLFQNTRSAAYAAALDRLSAKGLVYPCSCSRRDIQEAAAAPQEGVAIDGLVYPGTCRGGPTRPEAPQALRLNLSRAIEVLGGAAAIEGLHFTEIGQGPGGETGDICLMPDRLLEEAGDIVLRRRDGAVAYHLAVVVDDAWQGISHVTRGEDLFAATALHRLLQALLELPTPRYRHHRLIRDETGRRLAKRDDARSLAALREAGWQPRDIRRAVGL